MLENRALVLVTFGVCTAGTNRVTVRYFIVRELGLVLMPSVLIREARDSVRSGHGFAYKIFESAPAWIFPYTAPPPGPGNPM